MTINPEHEQHLDALNYYFEEKILQFCNDNQAGNLQSIASELIKDKEIQECFDAFMEVNNCKDNEFLSFFIFIKLFSYSKNNELVEGLLPEFLDIKKSIYSRENTYPSLEKRQEDIILQFMDMVASFDLDFAVYGNRINLLLSSLTAEDRLATINECLRHSVAKKNLLLSLNGIYAKNKTATCSDNTNTNASEPMLLAFKSKQDKTYEDEEPQQLTSPISPSMRS